MKLILVDPKPTLCEAWINWGYASRRQEEVRYGGDDGWNIPPELA